MKIAEVSRRYDISADTPRYYERVGLLRHVPRNALGIRDYDETSCKAVEFLKCMRSAGVSIEALIEYMDLFDEGDQTAPARKAALLICRRASTALTINLALRNGDSRSREGNASLDEQDFDLGRCRFFS